MTVVATTSVVVAAVSAAVAAAVAAAAPVAGPLTAGARWGGACIIVSRGMEPAIKNEECNCSISWNLPYKLQESAAVEA